MLETIQPKIGEIGYPMFFPSVGSNAAAATTTTTATTAAVAATTATTAAATTAAAAAAAEADKKVHRTKKIFAAFFISFPVLQ